MIMAVLYFVTGFSVIAYRESENHYAVSSARFGEKQANAVFQRCRQRAARWPLRPRA